MKNKTLSAFIAECEERIALLTQAVENIRAAEALLGQDKPAQAEPAKPKVRPFGRRKVKPVVPGSAADEKRRMKREANNRYRDKKRADKKRAERAAADKAAE